MSFDRWQQIEALYHAALKLEPSQRAAFLEEGCGGDAELRGEVESLLAADAQAQDFIESPALDMAAQALTEADPPTLVGKKLGAYQILSPLGAGGMGEVYKAQDTRLKRTVALKVLPLDRTSDPERKRRFVQEAQAASALNHPNIITIHDIGREDGIDFVVMEYVAGKTLEQLIPRHGTGLNDVLKISIQVADALAQAHAAGIIHRDLKPGNVMMTGDGLVKVLDFGLAKLTQSQTADAENESATSTRPKTAPGIVLGTVSYMSPEQAQGKAVDARSDVFAFGSLLYEMVTGRRAFQEDSTASTLAAILHQDPKPASELSHVVPRELETIINRCLRKDPEYRFQHLDDVKVLLREIKEESSSGGLAETDPAVRPSRRLWIWGAMAIVAVAMAVGLWLFRGSPRKPPAAIEVIPLTSYPGSETSPSFSPDGNQVVFSWNGARKDNCASNRRWDPCDFDIYVKLIGSPTPVPLTKDPADDVSPAFSPDGRSIGFVRVTKERATFIVIPSIGGPERSVADIPPPHASIDVALFAWFPDGKWVVIHGLALLSLETGEMRRLTSPPTKSFIDSSPAVSPDGHTIAFSRSARIFDWNIYLLDLTEDLKPKGEPRQLTFMKQTSWSPTWTSDAQEIIFTSGTGHSYFHSLWRIAASGDGKPEQLPFGRGEASRPAVSRSGNRLAYQRDVSNTNIWRLPLSGSGTVAGPPTQFIASTRGDFSPQYSPDGRIAFNSNQSGVWGIWVSDADGSNAMELFSRAGKFCGSPSWSPNGQRVAFDSNLEGNQDIFVIRASGGKPVRLTAHPSDDNVPSWSRDGQWIYFTSTRSGRYEVWKAPSKGGEATRVTWHGGFAALESLDGKTVYYSKGDQEASMALWRVSVSGGEEIQVLESVVWRAFVLVNDGIYFIPDPDVDGKYSIQFLNSATGKVKIVAPIQRPPSYGLSASPDRRYLLYTQLDEHSADLKLVENLR